MPTNPLPHPRPNTPAPVPEITHFGARDFLNERLPGRRSECPVDSWAWAWPRRNTMGATLLGPCLQAPQGRSRLARFGCFPGSGLPLVGLAGNRPSVAYFSVACFDLSPPPFSGDTLPSDAPQADGVGLVVEADGCVVQRRRQQYVQRASNPSHRPVG